MMKGYLSLYTSVWFGLFAMGQGGTVKINHWSDLRPVHVTLVDTHARGPVDAKVTVIEYGDYSCGYTTRMEPIVRKVMREDQGQVRFVFVHHWLPAHRHARLAAQIAIAAGLQGKFWEVHDMLFDKHFAAGPDGAIFEGYVPYLKTIPGLDIAKLRRDAESPEVNAMLDKELASFRSTATPEFVINGRIFTGQMTEAQFQQMIHEAAQ
jgi:protein-disulfide isomerase